MKFFDVVVVIVVGFAVFLSVKNAMAGSGTPQIRIRSADGEYIYPLDSDEIVEIPGPLGVSKIEMKDGRVRVSEDPGPMQICVNQGWIYEPGDWLVCLPSKIMITVEGEQRESPIDGLAF